jgi:hypothetical protein
LFKAYFKQARDELGIRLVTMLFEDGSKSKWWQVRTCSYPFISKNWSLIVSYCEQAFSKRKFMGKELKD